ncbi:MAG: Acetobutylicum phosphotransbutyrylase [Candidatus Woesebacteria bacterium GW2011_GWA1_39_8]|jgi:VanZ family protein|uniref:Acetobutylicum phosphotransbutyrylase n=1 Tax=Candidatus Woesebacteria bacterium GW2011_GWA1_39_8 TaxID=1618552 RepID=A0A0G0PL29_9BACT|nr:MAG: Acetobutylicum phosphotransbutyrylase [Candidatus Woesebacteria bacterium GW2011_GWA1_39_8]
MNPKLKSLLNLWLPIVIWALIIFNFSAHPAVQASVTHWQDFIVKKFAHLIEYAIFATLWYRALKESGIDKKMAGLYAIFICLAYGATDEFHQAFTPTREPTIRDVTIDTAGGIIGIFIIWKLLPKAPKKLKIWAEELHII